MRVAFPYLWLVGRVCLASDDIDSNGCDLTQGEFYCMSKNACVTDYDHCNMGHYDDEECTYTYNATLNKAFTYDLSALQVDKYIEITDEFTHTSLYYTYYFNVCKKVKSSDLPAACLETEGTGGDVCSGDAYGYQYISADWEYESCYRLSDCSDQGGRDVEIGLIDTVKPASGIYLLYTDGNTCPNSYSEKNQCFTTVGSNSYGGTYCSRSFKLKINCHNEISEIPEKEEIEEEEGCAYTASINHIMGCPIDCPRFNNRVCNAKGMCFYSGYDSGEKVDDDQVYDDDDDYWNTGNLQCLCQDGHYGDACQYEGYQVWVYSASEPITLPYSFFSFLMILSLLIVIVLLLLYRSTLLQHRGGTSYSSTLLCCLRGSDYRSIPTDADDDAGVEISHNSAFNNSKSFRSYHPAQPARSTAPSVVGRGAATKVFDIASSPAVSKIPFVDRPSYDSTPIMMERHGEDIEL